LIKTKDIIDFYNRINHKNTSPKECQNSVPAKYSSYENIPGDIIESHKRWINSEYERLRNLFEMEEELLNSGVKFIAGVDEVGRGPLAGPVVACAVVFDRFNFLPGLNDSKKMKEDIRDILFDEIYKCALHVSVGSANPEEIDHLNIHSAALLAMRRAVEGLPIRPGMILIDGKFTIPDIEFPQKAVVKGDGNVLSISAASVVAKVTRDRRMCEYDDKYPGYNFSSHKGYCTKKHVSAIIKLGPCPIHRKSFEPVKSMESEVEQLCFI